MERELTYGEKIAGVDFNPGGDEQVNITKRSFAAIIDQLDELRAKSENSEVKRMYSAAITDVQKAQMMAVKAITWKF